MCKVVLTESNFLEFLANVMDVEIPSNPKTKDEIIARFRELSGMDKYQER